MRGMFSNVISYFKKVCIRLCVFCTPNNVYAKFYDDRLSWPENVTEALKERTEVRSYLTNALEHLIFTYDCVVPRA